MQIKSLCSQTLGEERAVEGAWGRRALAHAVRVL